MKRVSQLVGLPVMALASGKRLGRVKALEISLESRRVHGIWVAREGFKGRSLFFSHQSIGLIGQRSVLVTGESEKGAARQAVPERVVSTAGERIGRVTDIRFDEDTLAVDSLEISLGFFEDWTQKRQWVDAFSQQGGQVVVPVTERVT